jgi:hypothetical protein
MHPFPYQRFFAMAALVALSAFPASGHLEPGSLSSPAAGVAYAAGASVRITWIQAEYHFGTYALAWSRNAGETWNPIASWTGPSGDGVTVHYAWTVPDAPGAKARVRVCQIGECGDPDYRLISGDFDIGPSTALGPGSGMLPGARLAMEGEKVTAEFRLDRPAEVVLEIRELSGRLRSVLLAGRHEAGGHRLRVEAGKRPRSGILRLRVGARTVAWARLPGP